MWHFDEAEIDTLSLNAVKFCSPEVPIVLAFIFNLAYELLHPPAPLRPSLDSASYRNAIRGTVCGISLMILSIFRHYTHDEDIHTANKHKTGKK